VSWQVIAVGAGEGRSGESRRAGWDGFGPASHNGKAWVGKFGHGASPWMGLGRPEPRGIGEDRRSGVGRLGPEGLGPSQWHGQGRLG